MNSLNTTQRHLLKLLLEIDAICKKYDIKYFIDYGTTLGAIRHEGFIPWDDDIDITMTESNYYKWVEACRIELNPEKRVYCDGRLDRDFPGVFGRYVDVETMRLASTFKFWEPICGQSIDVFCFLELPGDPEKKKECIDRYFVYDEYSNSSYRHYRMKTDNQMKLYRQCCFWEKIIGKEKVLRRLEKDIFHQHYSDCDTYIVTSARKKGPTSIVPKEYYDTTYMADFEGYKFPIAGKYIELLTLYYGDSYCMIPTDKKKHSPMSYTPLGCKYYVEDYMRRIDKKQMITDRKRYKHLAVEEGYRVTRDSIDFYKKLGSYELIKIKQKICREKINVNKILNAPACPETLSVLDSLFQEYYKKQLDGGLRYWEVYLDIGDELLYAALYTLIYFKNDYSSAYKILYLRELTGEPLSDELKDIKYMIALIRKIKAEIEYKHCHEANIYLSEGLNRYPDNCVFILDSLTLDVLMAHTDAELNQCAIKAKELLRSYPKNEQCIKALGDIAFAKGRLDDAKILYSWLEKNSANGMMLLDIKRKWRSCNDGNSKKTNAND